MAQPVVPVPAAPVAPAGPVPAAPGPLPAPPVGWSKALGSSVPGQPVNVATSKAKPIPAKAKRRLERPTETTRVIGPSGPVGYHRRRRFESSSRKKVERIPEQVALLESHEPPPFSVHSASD